VPLGSFLGAGAELQAPYVAWDPQSAGPAVAPWSEQAPFNLSLAQRSPQQVNLAPVFCGPGGGIALRGERGKAAAVSSFRFAAVAASCQSPGGGASLAVRLRGAPLEQVTLLWAAAPGWLAQATAVALDADGLASVALPPGAARD
jgi:hypothetical protein